MKLAYDYGGRLTDQWTGTEQASIERCIKNISQTVQGTTPFMRDMGLDSMLPKNSSAAHKNAYITDMLSEIAEWEDRVKVDEATFINDNIIEVVVSDG